MHVQSCCFAHLNLLLFCCSCCRRRCLGSDPYRLLGGCAGKWVKIRPLKHTYNAISRSHTQSIKSHMQLIVTLYSFLPLKVTSAIE